MKSRLLCRLSVVFACLLAVSASADTPRDLRDLVGEKAKKADPQLQRRGYIHIESEKTGSHNSYAMWWSPSMSTCVSVDYEHGRVDDIRRYPPMDCNQHGYFSDDDDDDSKAAALAVGAAALIGVLAVSHNSRHHDDDTHYDDQYSEEEFERGYRDGLYNHSYDNFNDTQSYSKGYQSGNRQRDHNSAYRHQNSHYDNGYRREADFSDLVGARASSADDGLQDLGFVNVDTIKSSNASYTYWYNGYTGQCLQMMTTNGRAEDIRDMGEYPQCR